MNPHLTPESETVAPLELQVLRSVFTAQGLLTQLQQICNGEIDPVLLTGYYFLITTDSITLAQYISCKSKSLLK